MRANDTETPMENASMDQVRDLLFGAKFKEIELLLARQEERFMQEVADAKDMLRQRLDSLENFTKSENTSLLNRIHTEKTEREESVKTTRRDLEEAVRIEQRERMEIIKSEQRERGDAITQVTKDLTAAVENLERKLSSLSTTLDAAETQLRQLLQTESNSLSNKIDDRYQQAQELIKRTADHIRHDMVYRNALSSMFTEVAVKLSGQDILSNLPGNGTPGPTKDVSAKQPKPIKDEGEKDA